MHQLSYRTGASHCSSKLLFLTWSNGMMVWSPRNSPGIPRIQPEFGIILCIYIYCIYIYNLLICKHIIYIYICKYICIYSIPGLGLYCKFYMIQLWNSIYKVVTPWCLLVFSPIQYHEADSWPLVTKQLSYLKFHIYTCNICIYIYIYIYIYNHLHIYSHPKSQALA